MRLLFIPYLLALAGCVSAPPPEIPRKTDPTAEAWYPKAVEELAQTAREADRLFRSGKDDEAARLVTRGQLLIGKLLAPPRPTPPAITAVSDIDDVYARMLLRNKHYAEARALFRKNVIRWRNVKPPTAESTRRLEIALAGVAECDRHVAE
jgi:hypothetical protein